MFSLSPFSFLLGSLISSHLPKLWQWIGYSKFPLGVNECVLGALSWTGCTRTRLYSSLTLNLPRVYSDSL